MTKSSTSPVFIFSASWRTGSTLLQRLLNTTDELLIWGEPQFLIPARRMFDLATKSFSEAQWMRDQAEEEPLHQMWAPTICPSPDSIVPAFKGLFDQLYNEPSLAKGFGRWGFKEVRNFGLENAIFFRAIYPDAKIVFHYRHPFDAYASLKRTDFFNSFEDAPFQPMQIWAKNYFGFKSQLAADLNAFVISHEEVVSAIPSENPKLKRLFDYIEVEMTDTCDEVLGNKLGGTSEGQGLSEEEKKKFRTILKERSVDLVDEYPDV